MPLSTQLPLFLLRRCPLLPLATAPSTYSQPKQTNKKCEKVVDGVFVPVRHVIYLNDHAFEHPLFIRKRIEGKDDCPSSLRQRSTHMYKLHLII